jgi:hypothetical protein
MKSNYVYPSEVYIVFLFVPSKSYSVCPNDIKLPVKSISCCHEEGVRVSYVSPKM